MAAGRSIYYGAMLYAGALLGGLWAGILFQLGCVLLAVHMTLDALLGPERRRRFPAVIALLAVATPLPFFVCYLMPDVFAGIAILAIANLFALEGALAPWKRLLWLALLAMALLFHTSHTAVALLVLAPAAAVAWAALRKPPWRAAATVGAAIGIGLLGEVVFALTVEAVYGAPPLRPPFLMARLVSDAPGYGYLLANCPGIGLRLCDWLPRLPADTDIFLWSRDPGRGVYGLADAATRRALAGEQAAFVLGVLGHDLPGQIVASLRDFAEQLGRFGLGEFAYDDYLRRTVADMLPPSERAAFVGSALYRRTFPLGLADTVTRVAVAAAAAYLLWAAARAVGGRRGTRPRGGRRAAGLRGGADRRRGGANAAVTGILSTPHDRYQARVIWLIPLLAMIVPPARPAARRGRRALGASDAHARSGPRPLPDPLPRLAALEIAVIVPCFNEASAIAKVVGDFRAALPPATIYVYDNNSPTDAGIARAGGAVVRREPRRARAIVVRRMFADIEADVFVMVDGDDTYEAAAAPRMVRRWPSGSSTWSSASGSASPGGLSARARLRQPPAVGAGAHLFGHGISDMLSGYRVFSRRFVKVFPAMSLGFEIETELTVHALELQMPAAESDTPYKDRAEVGQQAAHLSRRLAHPVHDHRLL